MHYIYPMKKRKHKVFISFYTFVNIILEKQKSKTQSKRRKAKGTGATLGKQRAKNIVNSDTSSEQSGIHQYQLHL